MENISANFPVHSMMKYIGSRVIRGPDWKWGKQVRQQFIYYHDIYYNFPPDHLPGSMQETFKRYPSFSFLGAVEYLVFF